jgi:hypothetical protein
VPLTDFLQLQYLRRLGLTHLVCQLVYPTVLRVWAAVRQPEDGCPLARAASQTLAVRGEPILSSGAPCGRQRDKSHMTNAPSSHISRLGFSGSAATSVVALACDPTGHLVRALPRGRGMSFSLKTSPLYACMHLAHRDRWARLLSQYGGLVQLMGRPAYVPLRHEGRLLRAFAGPIT